MKLVRFRLQPQGSWRTPWQADTLLGALAAVGARAHGPDWLERQLLSPWRDCDPPFVVSDACPGDLLPAPAFLPLFPGWPDSERKRVKKTAWLTPEQFAALQNGRTVQLPESKAAEAGFASNSEVLRPDVRMRNTLSRLTGTTGDPGSLFSLSATRLSSALTDLSLYARVAPGRESQLGDLLHQLGETGFGADVSTGFGHFRLAGGPEDASQLDSLVQARAWVSLSTFQPAPSDSTDGYWQSFVKYGKLGPDFGLDGVFKRPQFMLRQGACFQAAGPLHDWYGRCIDTRDLLSASTADQLQARGIRPVQPAFALAVPLKWNPEIQP